MSTYGLTSSGYVPRRTADWLTIIRDDYEARTGLSIDWTEDVVLGSLSAIMAERLAEADEVTQAVYDSRDPNNSTGVQLDALATTVGVTRQASTPSTATVTITGTSGVFIPTGSLVEGGGTNDNQRWETTADATITGAGTVDVEVKATEDGAVVATIGQIDEIVTPITGWASVTNAADATTGRDLETDAALRTRRQASLQITGAGNLPAIRAKLLALSHVAAALVQDHDQNSTITKNGIVMDPHSFAAVVFPTTAVASEQQDIWRAIYESAPVGIESMGAEIGTVQGQDLSDKEVRFSFSTGVSADVRVTLVLESGYVLADVQTAIEDIITDWFLTLRPGQTIYGYAVEVLIGMAPSLGGVAGVVSALVEFNIGAGWVTSQTFTAIEIAEEGTVSFV